MKILIGSDSFKGSLSARDVAINLREGIHRFSPDVQVELFPVADGGEGTCSAIVSAIGGEIVKRTVTGPNGDPVEAFFGVAGDMAIIEMAAASGLALVSGHLRPLQATTYGIGELMLHALDAGCKRMYLVLADLQPQTAVPEWRRLWVYGCLLPMAVRWAGVAVNWASLQKWMFLRLIRVLAHARSRWLPMYQTRCMEITAVLPCMARKRAATNRISHIWTATCDAMRAY